MSITLTELLSPRNRATLEAMLMAVLQGATIEGQPGTSFPVTDWIPGSLERTNLKMVVTGLLAPSALIRLNCDIVLQEVNGPQTGKGFLARLKRKTARLGSLVQLPALYENRD